MEIDLAMKNVNCLDVTGNFTGEVSSICYDSRQCAENSLFVAVSGLRHDGHAFIPDALARGARFIVYEKGCGWTGATTIRVADSRRALGTIGRNFYGDPSSLLSLVGIVGTNGKTTVTYMMESILKQAGHVVGILGTVNYRFLDTVLPAPNTTPESIDVQKILRQMVDQGVTHVVAEVTSHAIDLHRIDDCAFVVGVFTNLSRDHLDYHGTMENYFQAKKRFFTEILPGGETRRPWMIVNGDDAWGQRLTRDARSDLSLLTFGLEKGCDVRVEKFSLSSEGTEATVRTPEGRFPLTIPLIGKFNLYNGLAAVAATFALGASEESIRAGMAQLQHVPGRLEKVSTPDGPHVFIDYAHTEDALSKALENLLEFKEGRIITVFGCGGDRDRGKRPFMGKAAVKLSDLVFVTSDNPRMEDPLAIIGNIEEGIRETGVRKIALEDASHHKGEKAYIVIPDRREAIAAAIRAADAADTVLIAGKGHEDYQIIGSSRSPFDDRKIAMEILGEKRAGRGCPP